MYHDGTSQNFLILNQSSRNFDQKQKKDVPDGPKTLESRKINLKRPKREKKENS